MNVIFVLIIMAGLAFISIIEPVKDGPFNPTTDVSSFTPDKEVYDENAHRVLRSK